MRNLLLINFVLLSFIACKSQKQTELHEHISEFKTATGKVITVTEKHSESASLVSITIQTNGFENDDNFTLTDIDPISTIKLADFDQNGFDELYIITQAVGSGSYQNVIGYASNRDKSFTPIYFPELTDKDFDKGGLYEGYMGHDTFVFKKDKLVRKFPIYLENDSNSNPSGGEKEISYLLVLGEASWQLKVQNTYQEKVQVVRDCSGTYIKMKGLDYKVCNDELLADLENESFATLSFIDVSTCKVEEGVAVCMLYHEHVGIVKVLEIH